MMRQLSNKVSSENMEEALRCGLYRSVSQILSGKGVDTVLQSTCTLQLRCLLFLGIAKKSFKSYLPEVQSLFICLSDDSTNSFSEPTLSHALSTYSLLLNLSPAKSSSVVIVKQCEKLGGLLNAIIQKNRLMTSVVENSTMGSSVSGAGNIASLTEHCVAAVGMKYALSIFLKCPLMLEILNKAELLSEY